MRDGIIPARAGFTGCRPGRFRPAPDHPRSRRVYQFSYSNPDGNLGSSPLARGLQRLGRRPGKGRRIIPARAGFTAGTGGTTATRREHHRSRVGYYAF